MAHEVYRFNNREPDARNELDAIERIVSGSPRRYATPEGLVALGRFFLIRGEDARKVLDRCYDIVTKQQPDYIDAHFATAELALEKDDGALAAETLRKAPRAAALEPHFHYLMARALSSENRAGSAKELAEALKINPKHVDSLLLQADQLIDGEQYAEAAQSAQAGARCQPARAAGMGIPGSTGASPKRRGQRNGRAAVGAREVERESRGRPSDRSQAIAEVPVHRGGGRQRRALELDPIISPPRFSSARICSGWATKQTDGNSLPRSLAGTAITWSPTT